MTMLFTGVTYVGSTCYNIHIAIHTITVKRTLDSIVLRKWYHLIVWIEIRSSMMLYKEYNCSIRDIVTEINVK